MWRTILFILSIVFCQSEIQDVQGLTIDKHDNTIFIHNPHIQSTPDSVQVTEIADLLTRTFWAGQLTSSSPLKLDHSAATPPANLLLVNFGLDSKDLPSRPAFKGQQLRLTYDFFPADSVSILTSMTTSKEPSEHGVVGSTWSVNNEEVGAYTSDSSFSSKLSFPQIINAHHEGTKVIAGSSNAQLAKAFAQGSFHTESCTSDSMQSRNGFDFTKQDLQASLREQSFWQDLPWKEINQDDPKALAFLMEIEYIRRLADSMTEDSTPVLYNVATTTPEGEAARMILFAGLMYIQNRFSAVHPAGNSQIAFVKEPLVLGESVKEIHFQAKEFQETGNSTGSIYTPVDSRGYQIGVWVFVAFFLIIICFSSSFSSMEYQDDPVLFSQWKRSAKGKGHGKPLAMGMGANDIGMQSFAR